MAPLPWIGDGLVDQVAVVFPARIGSACKEVGDGIPVLPTTWGCGSQSGGETTGNRDVDLLSCLDASDQIGGVLSKLS